MSGDCGGVFKSRGYVLLRIVVRHRSFPRREMSLEGMPEGLLPVAKVSERQREFESEMSRREELRPSCVSSEAWRIEIVELV